METPKTLEDLHADYIQECQYTSRLSRETIRGYKEVHRLFITLTPEVTSPQLLTTELLATFFKRLQVRERTIGNGKVCIGVKPATIKTYWSKLNIYFEWLKRKEYIHENPLQQLKPPQYHYTNIQYIKKKDVHRLYAAITLHSKNILVQRRDTAMVSLLLFCGLRLGEFIALEVQDLDLEKLLLTVRRETSKSRKVRHIPIHPTLRLHLLDYLKERKNKRYTTSKLIVSANENIGLSKHGLKHWVKSLNVKSGVRFHLHQFRHTFACNLAKNDVGAVKIQKLLGHCSLDMTMMYLCSIEAKDLKEDIAKLSI